MEDVLHDPQVLLKDPQQLDKLLLNLVLDDRLLGRVSKGFKSFSC